MLSKMCSKRRGRDSAMFEMMNEMNSNNIANSVGRCIRIEENQIMQQRTYLRLLVEVDVDEPVMPCFN